MSRAVKFAVLAPVAAFLSGCETPPVSSVALLPARDRLYTPAEITPGRFQYAREPEAFAPVLTDRVAYPTQEQANKAFDREDMTSSYPTKGPYVIRPSDPLPTVRRAASIRLFACKPGVLNSVTGRIVEGQTHAVHCATDFLDRAGRGLSRETVNFYYSAGAWRTLETNAPTMPAAWINPERSPSDPFSWFPLGKRSTPY